MFNTVIALAITTFMSLAVSAAPTPQLDIIDQAVAAGQFKTLVAALEAADLVDTLKGTGPFTVFAPTDAAFASLPAGTIERLMADKKALTKVLLDHVVAGKVFPRQLLLTPNVPTLGGQPINVLISRPDNKIYVNNAVLVADPVYVSNGVIYIIDAVLLP